MSKQRALKPIDAALRIIARGLNPVPVKYKDKAPSAGPGWEKIIITKKTAPQYFNGGPQNIGIQWGANSKGACDVDLDCAEAIAAAPYLLPDTDAKFGRESAPASHWIYNSNLHKTHNTATIQFKDPIAKNGDAMLVELRIGGGGKGAQTVAPGSIHKETGEAIRWDCDGKAAAIAGDKLLAQVELVAATALLARHWPAEGARHDAALALGGFPARAGYKPKEVAAIVTVIAKVAKDEEAEDRAKARPPTTPSIMPTPTRASGCRS